MYARPMLVDASLDYLSGFAALQADALARAIYKVTQIQASDYWINQVKVVLLEKTTSSTS